MTTIEGFDNTNIIVTDTDPSIAGAFVWWRLSGDMNIEKLEEVWAEKGLTEPRPAKPSTQVALRRAVNEQANRRRLVRPLQKESGYAIVDEHPDSEKTLDYKVLCKITFNKLGEVTITDGPETMHTEILAAYKRHLASVSASDVREWLTGTIIPSVLALKLRDGGGVYFIPQGTLSRFRDIVKCVKWSSDHAIFAVPAMKTVDAVEGIIDALQHEARAELEQLQEELAKGDLGVRALKSRMDRCAQQEKKLSKYEEMLGKKQETIREGIMNMRASLVEAIMTQGDE